MIDKVDFARLSTGSKKIQFVNTVIDCDGDVVKACEQLGMRYSQYERWALKKTFRKMMELVDVSIAYKAQASLVEQARLGSVMAARAILKEKGHLIDWVYDPNRIPDEGDLNLGEDVDNETRVTLTRKILNIDGHKRISKAV